MATRKKTKEVISIEKKLKPKKVFFVKSCCCGGAWFMDYNYMGEGNPNWRISHNLKSKKIYLVSYSDFNSGRASNIKFKTPKELFVFIEKYLK